MFYNINLLITAAKHALKEIDHKQKIGVYSALTCISVISAVFTNKFGSSVLKNTGCM